MPGLPPRSTLRRQWTVAGALLAISLAAGAASYGALEVSDETDMDGARLATLTREFSDWAQRVDQYLHVDQPAPSKLVFTRKTHVGMYIEGTMYMPPDDHDEMVETFIHEYAHRATGHDSSYFFKEGIATHTLEALMLQQGHLPQGWPQYGVSNDAWIALFRRNHQLMPLQEAMDWPHYDGSNPEGDYHSWQIYIMGGSFAGWYIKNYGYVAFKQVFDQAKLPGSTADMEKRWLAEIRKRKPVSFDPGPQLPSEPRYQNFAKHLPLH